MTGECILTSSVTARAGYIASTKVRTEVKRPYVCLYGRDGSRKYLVSCSHPLYQLLVFQLTIGLAELFARHADVGAHALLLQAHLSCDLLFAEAFNLKEQARPRFGRHLRQCELDQFLLLDFVFKAGGVFIAEVFIRVAPARLVSFAAAEMVQRRTSSDPVQPAAEAPPIQDARDGAPGLGKGLGC